MSEQAQFPTTGPSAVRRPSKWRSRLRVVVFSIVAVAAIVALASNWQQLLAALRSLSPWSVLASFPLALLAMVVSLFTWRSLMTDFGARLSVGDAARIFYLSQLGKYIPGSFWSILSQAELGRDSRVPRRTSFLVGVMAIVIAQGVGLALAIVTLPFVAPVALERYWWVALAAPLFLIGLHPVLLTRGVNLVLRKLRRQPLDHPPSWRGLMRTAAWQVLVWLILSLHVWVLVVGLGGPPGRALPAAIGGYVLAHCLGLLAIGMPAGAGVRELALTAALASVISAPEALVVALISRALLTAVDLLMAGIQIRRRRRHLGRDEVPHRTEPAVVPAGSVGHPASALARTEHAGVSAAPAIGAPDGGPARPDPGPGAATDSATG